MAQLINIQAGYRPRWQSAIYAVLGAPKGNVNIHFELEDYRNIPLGTRAPEDWDVILKGFAWLAVGVGNQLNVDCGKGPDSGDCNLITPSTGSETRTLLDCVLAALQEWFWQHDDTHHPKLHPDWYSDVEHWHDGACVSMLAPLDPDDMEGYM